MNRKTIVVLSVIVLSFILIPTAQTQPLEEKTGEILEKLTTAYESGKVPIQMKDRDTDE